MRVQAPWARHWRYQHRFGHMHGVEVLEFAAPGLIRPESMCLEEHRTSVTSEEPQSPGLHLLSRFARRSRPCVVETV